MAVNHPVPGEGTTIAYSLTIPPTSYTSITATVIDIEPAGGKVTAVETSGLQSKAKTVRAGQIPESGEVTFTLLYDPNDTTVQALTNLMSTPALVAFQVTYNANNVTTQPNDTFEGVVTQFKPGKAQPNKNIEAEFTIEISGLVTRTPGV